MRGRTEHRGVTVRVLGVVRARVSRAIDFVRDAIRGGGGTANTTQPGRALARLPDGTRVTIRVRAVDPVAERERLRAFYAREGYPIPELLKEGNDAETE